MLKESRDVALMCMGGVEGVGMSSAEEMMVLASGDGGGEVSVVAAGEVVVTRFVRLRGGGCMSC